ncbi:hypothetical protein Glove_256g112 [Diversispora epigaea]|uniref:BACK domain-containing protein n=1 Tax=Diversispora epigaea TaxID=1348612 RepID=A0A397IBF3_9GLOM|nr:hypothetical protein Glove_256g112 [Diversispora epigaea]
MTQFYDRLSNDLMSHIYIGKVLLDKLDNSFIFDLLIASNELELDELIDYLQTYLINNCVRFSVKSKFAQIYRTSYQVKNLEDFCNNIIAKYSNTIFESGNFDYLPEGALISILKRDDLQLKESKIWGYLIQWGKAKNPNLPIGNRQIYPYQQLLEHQLFSDINFEYTKISNIMPNEHTLEISSWIDMIKKKPPVLKIIHINFNYLPEDLEIVKGMGGISRGYNSLENDDRPKKPKIDEGEGYEVF